eukprot:5043687-Prorocentrum_lima.AAC.1
MDRDPLNEVLSRNMDHLMVNPVYESVMVPTELECPIYHMKAIMKRTIDEGTIYPFAAGCRPDQLALAS